MSVHLMRDLEALRRDALDMCAQVERNVGDAARAFLEVDPALAQSVIAADQRVNLMDLELDEECLKILALYHPVAGDLRFVFSLVKIVAMLERTSDLAENLARKARTLAKRSAVAVPQEFSRMAAAAGKMLNNSIEAFIRQDSGLAKDVINSDEEVNQYKRQIRKFAEKAIMADPESCPQWLAVIAAARNLERIGDMAANIAAEVVYSVDGKKIRHLSDVE